MVNFTTAIIFQYVYFIPQKAKSFAITYFCVACYSINWFHNLRRHFVYKVSARDTELPPPFFNFLFTYLFSIQFLYFFIISSLFPYFNLFVSICIPSYANSNLHVSILCILIIHGGLMVSVLASRAVNRGFEHRSV